MKKMKYFPWYFLLFLGMCILCQKFVLVAHGMPMGGYSWSQIWMRMPFYVILSSLIAVYANYITKNIIKKQISDTIEAKKRIEEREKNYSSPNTHECRVCGCCSEDFPWGEDGKSPSYQICPCCGVQFGKEDSTLESIKEYRAAWKNNGGKWFMKNEKPSGWDIEQQMKHIPNEFK